MHQYRYFLVLLSCISTGQASEASEEYPYRINFYHDGLHHSGADLKRQALYYDSAKSLPEELMILDRLCIVEFCLTSA